MKPTNIFVCKKYGPCFSSNNAKKLGRTDRRIVGQNKNNNGLVGMDDLKIAVINQDKKPPTLKLNIILRRI
jgi:hypothetical protein